MAMRITINCFLWKPSRMRQVPNHLFDKHSSSYDSCALCRGLRSIAQGTWSMHLIGIVLFGASLYITTLQPYTMMVYRYDLNCLFAKSFGSMSVNVQGVSRVCSAHAFQTNIEVDSHSPMKGMSLMRALYWGRKGARTNYHLQISTIVRAAYSSLNESVPVIIGECGIPMDMKCVRHPYGLMPC